MKAQGSNGSGAETNPIMQLHSSIVEQQTTDSTTSGLLDTRESLRSAVDALGTNVFIADRNLKLLYMNRNAAATLKTLESTLQRLFGIGVENLIGINLDALHGNRAASIRRQLDNIENLPIRKEIRLGEFTLDLNVSAVRDAAGDYVGTIVNWEDVTVRKRLEDGVAKMQAMIENAPVNIMRANTDLVIEYINPSSLKTLKTLEHLLPIKADQVLGSCIDIFHKNPAHQRGMLADPRKLPHQAQIKLGDQTLDLLVSPIYDGSGTYLGPMVTWQVITQKIEAERREKEMLGRVADSAASVASSSSQLTAVSQQLTSSAEETASQANVVSAASEEVSKNIEVVATSAQELLSSIREIAKSASEAAKVAREAVTVAQATNTTISQLGNSSQEIGKVIKVITSIAQQTNLLALNATIEAARAGEAGKGFAVVANEVKELAKETARATEEIGRKIEAIQSDTDKAVGAIGEVSGIINQISDISNIIASAVEEQTATTNEIGRNVGEAARGANEIARNISGVATAAQNTSGGALDTQKAAESLSGTAGELQELVKRFNK